MRADRAVEPTKSENITVTWRRSAASWGLGSVNAGSVNAGFGDVGAASASSAIARNQGGTYGAPGPIAGEGVPILVLGAAGFGAYWLVRRHRRKHT